jgi:hypothetical protein
MTQALDSLTRSVPKVISPGMHAVADYTTVATLAALGSRLRYTNPPASTFAYANAGLVAMMSLMTDYPGGIARGISFRTHGMMDVVQAGLMALAPALLGFSGTPEAKLFYGQAALEMGIVSATDWDAA